MIYELRLYTVMPGRMADNHNRFERHLPALFERHGIANVGRWTAISGPNAPMFIYMMAYHDLAERERQWAEFYGDEEWWSIRARTNGAEQMVERFDLFFLKPNVIWFADPARANDRLGGIHELLIAEIALGHQAEANAILSETLIPLVERRGGCIMMVADLISGVALPKTAMMVAWPDAAAQHAGRLAIDRDSGLQAATASQRKAIGRPPIGRTDIYVLEPTAFALPLATLGRGKVAAD